MSFSVTIQRVRTSFNSTFWIANSLELFERFAFYGSKAILVVYLANRLDLGVEAAASLAGMYAGIMYSLPLVAGVFVDRYGFRKTLAACFFLFALGYFLIALPCLDLGAALVQSVGPTPYITAVLVLTSIGGSLIKPCIVGTVAKTTVPETASLGYSIYYSIVNIGGALGPIFALQIRHLLGIEYVLVMASVVSACLFLGTLAFFREPDKPLETVETAQSASFTKIFKDMLMVFSNIKFITFLTLLSSFYLMFWQLFYALPFYVLEVLHYENFELLETVNAWIIIGASIPMGILTRHWSALRAIVSGLMLASCSWLCFAIAPTIPAALVGIALFAIGEATLSPRLYEYVATLAPKEQVGTYMGFAFLPVAIGSFAGGPLGGYLVEKYLHETYQPEMIWYIVASIGIIACLLLLIYAQIVKSGVEGDEMQVELAS